MKKTHPYIHLIDNEIKHSSEIHPYNDKTKNDLFDKTPFVECLLKDLTNGVAKKLDDDDDYQFKDISKGKNNLFSFHLTNNQEYNIFVEHPDGGGKDISFGKNSKKVLIPYSNRAFRNLIKEMKNVLVVNIYFQLKTVDGKEVPDLENYVYLVIIPSEIYISEVTYNILYDEKKANGSSR
jgi:hypothetical protein